jgi:hypothetical protein
MNHKQKTLLIVDGAINLLLGALLFLLPFGLADVLGVYRPQVCFYPSILGAVLLGIGVALMIEAFGSRHGIRGLGLGGAIAINLCGGGVLAAWLFLFPHDLPARGQILLWSIAIVVLGVGLTELVTKSWK